jgi:hypothetical protein
VTYVNGRDVQGAETSFNLEASVQRLDMRERQLLEEGYRTRDTRKIYFPENPNIVALENNQTQPINEASEFEFDGNRYVMLADEGWDTVIPHLKVTVVRKQ